MKWLIALLKVETCNLAFSFLRIGWIMFLVIWHLSFFLLLVCSKHWSPVSHSRGILPGMESCSLQHAVIWSGEQLTCLSIFASEHIFSSLFVYLSWTWVDHTCTWKFPRVSERAHLNKQHCEDQGERTGFGTKIWKSYCSAFGYKNPKLWTSTRATFKSIIYGT